MNLESLGYHVRRLRRELGQKLELGGRGYRVRGYIPNRLTTDFRHEQHLLAPLRRAIDAKAGLFIDVGVNTGQTLLKLLSIEPARPYIGFEPQIACAHFVDQFLRDNHVITARIVPIALSDGNGTLPLFSEGQVDEMASLVERSTTRFERHNVETHYIAARIGDEVLSEMAVGPIGIIKVDVEGAELNVFRGLTQTIAASRPICFFELLPNFVGPAGARTPIDLENAVKNREMATGLQAFFAEAGYRLLQIDDQGRERSIEAFDLDTPDRFVSSDYVAYPN